MNLEIIQGFTHKENWVKGGFKSENSRQFFGSPKNIPKNCFKFVHPVHDNDKMSILNFFDFTSLINLQVYKKVSNAIMKNPILSKPFIHTQKNSKDSFLYFYFITVIFLTCNLLNFTNSLSLLCTG